MYFFIPKMKYYFDVLRQLIKWKKIYFAKFKLLFEINHAKFKYSLFYMLMSLFYAFLLIYPSICYLSETTWTFSEICHKKYVNAISIAL